MDEVFSLLNKRFKMTLNVWAASYDIVHGFQISNKYGLNDFRFIDEKCL